MRSYVCLLAAAFMLLTSHGSFAQNGWYNPDEKVDQCHASDTCHCQFTGQWNVLDSYFELMKYSNELGIIDSRVKELDLTKLIEQTSVLLRELDGYEARIQNISVQAALQEYKVLEQRANFLAVNVDRALQDGIREEEVLAYERKTTNITASLDVLWHENPYAVKDDLNEKVTELTGKLSSCQQLTDGSYFRGDSLPSNLNDDWCDIYEPVSIGDSLAHGTASTASGNWFKDPYPVNEVNKTTVWIRGYTAYSSYGPFVYAQNYSEFIDILAQKRWSPNTHNTRTYGIGYLMYNGSLYYHYGNEIVKFTLSNNAIHKVPLAPTATEYLRHSSITRVDMKVDEYGLYAIYTDASNDEKLIISKINPQTLETIQTWHTNKHKATVCATFMICGKLYTLANCWSRLDTEAHHKQYTFNTLTGKETYENWHLTSKFGHVWMVGYNPRERFLFGWDNTHLVTYPLTWRRKNINNSA